VQYSIQRAVYKTAAAYVVDELQTVFRMEVTLKQFKPYLY